MEEDKPTHSVRGPVANAGLVSVKHKTRAETREAMEEDIIVSEGLRSMGQSSLYTHSDMHA
jgi:hypothetical protein